MTRLVETQTSQLARAIRAAKDRQRPPAAHRTSGAAKAFDTLLATQKAVFSDGLVAIIDSLLQALVYGPLVSMTAQQAASSLVSHLSPQLNVEQLANNSDKVAEVLEHQDDPHAAFEDGLFRQWRGGVRSIDFATLRPAQLEDLSYEPVEGTQDSVAQLLRSYGQTVVFYRDLQGRLYVQRPSCESYAAGVSAGTPAGAPEFQAVAKTSGRDITFASTPHIYSRQA